MICPLCNREAPITDGALGIHYNRGLNRCEGSGLEAEVPEPKPVKKAAPRKKAPPKK